MKKIIQWGFFLLFVWMGVISSFASTGEQTFPMAVVSIEGEINSAKEALLQRAIRESEEKGVKVLVLSLNTTGGRVDSALAMRDMLVKVPFTTAAYVAPRAWSAGALIALSTDTIIMAPGSSIGAAEPIPATEKNISAIRSDFAATAMKKEHPKEVAEAMVDKSLGFEKFADKGQILTLTDVQAVEAGLAVGTKQGKEEVIQYFTHGKEPQALWEYEESWTDTLLGWLHQPVFSILLIALIFIGFVVEIKLGGIGLGLGTTLVGVLILSSIQWGLGIHSWWTVGALLLGLMCMGIEIFIPGFGIFGIAGIVLVLGSLFFLLGATVEAAYMLLGGLVLAIIVGYLLWKYLPGSPLDRAVVLRERSETKKGYVTSDNKRSLLHCIGVTETVLRPAGTALIEGKRIDVVAENQYIRKGVSIEVVAVEGGRVVVAPAFIKKEEI